MSRSINLIDKWNGTLEATILGLKSKIDRHAGGMGWSSQEARQDQSRGMEMHKIIMGSAYRSPTISIPA